MVVLDLDLVCFAKKYNNNIKDIKEIVLVKFIANLLQELTEKATKIITYMM